MDKSRINQLITREEYNKSRKMDLRVILALGTTPYLYNDLKTIYNSDKQRYYKLYRESKYYNHLLWESYNGKTNEQLIYAIAIYVADETTHLVRLMKKAYKSIHNYVISSKAVVDGAEYLRKYHSRNVKVGEQMLSEIEILNAQTALQYFSEVYHKNLALLQGDPMEIMFQNYLNSRLDGLVKDREKAKQGVRDLQNSYKDLKTDIFGIKSKQITFENFCETVVNNEIAMNGMELLDETSRDKVFERGVFSRYLAYFNTVLRLQGVGEEVLGQIELTDEDFYNVLFHLQSLNATTNGVDFRNMSSLIISSIFIRVLAKEYKELRNAYLVKSLEENHYIVEKTIDNNYKAMEQKVKKAESSIMQLESYKENVVFLTNQNKALTKEVSKVQRELKAKENEITKLEENMRKITVQLENQQNMEDSLYNAQLKACQLTPLLIIGGNQSWVNTTKKVLPKAEFVDIDKNMDYSYIKTFKGLVIVNTATNNHGFMSGIKNHLEGIDYKHINGNYGVKRTVTEIFNLL